LLRNLLIASSYQLMSCDREVAPPETEERCFPEAVDAPQQLHEHPAFLILQPGQHNIRLTPLSHFTANQVVGVRAILPLASSYEFCRPGGNSSIWLTSNPCKVSASVRGIGVAVIVSTWEIHLLLWRACPTPNRCCSSITTKPSRWKFTFLN